MSNLQLKAINISPELLNIKPKNIRNKTLKKQKPTTNMVSTKLKKNLLEKIKNYKQNKFTKSSQDESIAKTLPIIAINKAICKENTKKELFNPDDDLGKSINYLQNLSLHKKNKLNNKEFLEKTNDQSLERTNDQSLERTNVQSLERTDDQSLERTDDQSLETNGSPKYGCLKNGTLPTYKEWKNKTLKNPHTELNPYTELNPHAEINIDNNIEYNSNIPSKTKTLKYYLGKRGRKVSILVKNSETRKKISKEHNLLNQENIFTMKNYLKKHNLLKSGSHAPPNVIKKIYEQSLLSGDIQNSNKDNIIHNYLAE